MKTIGFIGSFGTGKSTAFAALRNQRPGMLYFEEAIRHQVEVFGKLDHHAFIAKHGIATFLLLNTNSLSVIDPEVNPLLLPERVAVVDQTSVGQYGYYLALRKPGIDFELESLITHMARHYAGLIDQFIYFPIDVLPLEGDALRQTDVATQHAVDQGVQEALRILNVPAEKVHMLKSVDLKERVAEIIAVTGL